MRVQFGILHGCANNSDERRTLTANHLRAHVSSPAAQQRHTPLKSIFIKFGIALIQSILRLGPNMICRND